MENPKSHKIWLFGRTLNTLFWRLPTFAMKTIIGSVALNFSVRNGKRCDCYDKAPEHYIQSYIFLIVVCKFLNRNRNISTSQLNALLRLHLKPINVIISHGSITIPNLEAGFPLRCFQRLSIPDIATEHSTWQ